MTTSKAESTFVRVSIKQLVDLTLGRGYWHSRAIPLEIAELLLHNSKNDPDYGFHIQEADELSPNLTEPVLWRYSAWADDADRREKAKRYSDKCRIERFIRDANVKIIAKKVSSFFMLEGDLPNIIAFAWLKNKEMNKIKCVGVVKLIEKEEEL